MLHTIFSIYDKKSENYSNPFTAVNKVVAIRDLTSTMEDKEILLYKYASDYSLNEIGVFNTETGEITGTKLKLVIEIQEIKDLQNG